MLTIKKKKFAKLVARTGNIQQSYIDAGYSPKFVNVNAYKLSGEEEVSKLISIELDLVCNMTQEVWSTKLIGLLDHKDAKVSDMTRILELYGRHKGFLNAEQTNITIANIGEKELERIRSKRLASLEPLQPSTTDEAKTI